MAPYTRLAWRPYSLTISFLLVPTTRRRRPQRELSYIQKRLTAFRLNCGHIQIIVNPVPSRTYVHHHPGPTGDSGLYTYVDRVGLVRGHVYKRVRRHGP